MSDKPLSSSLTAVASAAFQDGRARGERSINFATWQSARYRLCIFHSDEWLGGPGEFEPQPRDYEFLDIAVKSMKIKQMQA